MINKLKKYTINIQIFKIEFKLFMNSPKSTTYIPTLTSNFIEKTTSPHIQNMFIIDINMNIFGTLHIN